MIFHLQFFSLAFPRRTRLESWSIERDPLRVKRWYQRDDTVFNSWNGSIGLAMISRFQDCHLLRFWEPSSTGCHNAKTLELPSRRRAGNLGSELRKDGQLIWSFQTGQRTAHAKCWLRESAKHLLMAADDPKRPYLDDGVGANALVSVPQMIAKFFKSDGYDRLREHLLSSFQLEPVGQGPGGNYLEFPYDWRRDNRAGCIV